MLKAKNISTDRINSIALMQAKYLQLYTTWKSTYYKVLKHNINNTSLNDNVVHGIATWMWALGI